MLLRCIWVDVKLNFVILVNTHRTMTSSNLIHLSAQMYPIFMYIVRQTLCIPSYKPPGKWKTIDFKMPQYSCPYWHYRMPWAILSSSALHSPGWLSALKTCLAVLNVLCCVSLCLLLTAASRGRENSLAFGWEMWSKLKPFLSFISEWAGCGPAGLPAQPSHHSKDKVLQLHLLKDQNNSAAVLCFNGMDS